MVTKVRIVERTHPDGQVQYVIQQRDCWVKWIWVDAAMNSLDYANCQDHFATLEQAQAALWQFDGSRAVDRVVEEH